MRNENAFKGYAIKTRHKQLYKRRVTKKRDNAKTTAIHCLDKYKTVDATYAGINSHLNSSTNAADSSKSNSFTRNTPENAGKSTKTENTQNKPQTDTKDKSEGPPRRLYNQISSETIASDCSAHGYTVIKTIGAGAYAKVKLAEATPSKLARNPDLAEHADDDGNVKVRTSLHLC